MIVQCAECSARFRLDDSKIGEKGVRVRCSKCRHIFVVQKEAPAEEPDLDSFLSSLEGGESSGGKVPDPNAEERADAGAAGSFAFDGADSGSDSSAEEPASSPPAGGEGFADDDLFSAPEPSPPASAQALPVEDESFDGEESFGDEEPFAAAGASSVELSPATESFQAGGDSSFDFSEQAGGEEFQFSGSTEETPSSFGEYRPPETAEAEEFSFTEEEPEARQWEPPVVKEEFSFDAASETGGFEEEATAEAVPEAAGGFEDFELDIDGGKRDDQAVALPAEEDFSLDFASDAVASPAAQVPAPAEEWSFDAPADEVVVASSVEEVPFSPRTVETAKASAAPAAEAAAFRLEDLAAESDEEEDLPPLVISSRRQKSSFPLVKALAAVVVVAVVGGGAFFYLGEPGRLDSLAELGGIAGEKGSIEIRKVEGSFVSNPDGGELFVVRGEAIDSRRKQEAVQVRAKLLAAGGAVLAQKTSFCGSDITPEQLAALPVARIEEALQRPPADAASKAGGVTPFVVVFQGVPKEAVDFAAEIVSVPPAK